VRDCVLRMVVVHLKRAEDNQFLYECSVEDSVGHVQDELLKIHNTRIRVLRLADSVEELAQYGPSKTQAEQGIDSVLDDVAKSEGRALPTRGPHYNADPTGRRTGEAPEPKLREVLQRQVSEARIAANCKDHMAAKRNLTVKFMQEAWDCLRGAVTIAYPEGLPEYDEVVLCLQDSEEPDSRTADIMEPENTAMWWANKQLEKDKKMKDYVGRNEKTKIVAKLTKSGAGAPSREPAIDEATQKQMMAFYHKKQEEMKKLEADADDSFLDSSWADPRALKKSLVGGGGQIRFR